MEKQISKQTQSNIYCDLEKEWVRTTNEKMEGLVQTWKSFFNQKCQILVTDKFKKQDISTVNTEFRVGETRKYGGISNKMKALGGIWWVEFGAY